MYACLQWNVLLNVSPSIWPVTALDISEHISWSVIALEFMSLFCSCSETCALNLSCFRWILLNRGGCLWSKLLLLCLLFMHVWWLGWGWNVVHGLGLVMPQWVQWTWKGKPTLTKSIIAMTLSALTCFVCVELPFSICVTYLGRETCWGIQLDCGSWGRWVVPWCCHLGTKPTIKYFSRGSSW
jgi:hypothetical protein